MNNEENSEIAKLKKENELSDPVKALIKDYIEGQKLSEIEVESLKENLSEDAKDIDVMFERLNREYFNGKIQATVKWGRDVKTQNNFFLVFMYLQTLLGKVFQQAFSLFIFGLIYVACLINNFRW